MDGHQKQAVGGNQQKVGASRKRNKWRMQVSGGSGTRGRWEGGEEVVGRQAL